VVCAATVPALLQALSLPLGVQMAMLEGRSWTFPLLREAYWSTVLRTRVGP
jgi:hypothetical protein